MKKHFNYIILFQLFLGTLFSQTPDFSILGYGAAATGAGASGNIISVSDLGELRSALLLTDACIIEISDTIEGVFATKDIEKDSNLLEVKSNKTILGIGSNAFLSNIQLYLKNAQNIIIRNLKFSMIGSSLGGDADIISIATTSSGECKDIWIDHCEFFNETPTLPETSAKKDLYDGMIDIKKTSHNITISWNYFHDHWKCSLVGFTDTDTFDRKITYHHNYFKNIKSRVPSYRGGTGHIYNNYFDGLADAATQPSSEGVHSREGACLKVEANYFRNYNKSIYSAIEDVTIPGYAYGEANIFESSPELSTDSCDISVPYAYTLDNGDSIPALVTQWAGVGKLDPNAPTLSSPANAIQTIEKGSAISDIIYHWSGGTTNVSISDLPVGLIPIKDFETKSLSISGVPESAGTFQIATSGGEGSIIRNGAIRFQNEDYFEDVAVTDDFSCVPTLVKNETHIFIHSTESAVATLSIYDGKGRLVSEQNIKLVYGANSYTLKMEYYKTGLYILHLRSDNIFRIAKLLKQ